MKKEEDGDHQVKTGLDDLGLEVKAVTQEQNIKILPQEENHDRSPDMMKKSSSQPELLLKQQNQHEVHQVAQQALPQAVHQVMPQLIKSTQK